MTATAAKVNSRSFNFDRYYFSWLPENHVQVQKRKDNIVHKTWDEAFSRRRRAKKKKMESSCFASGVLDVLGLRNRIMAYFAIVGENEAWVDFFWYSPSCLFSSWCSYVKKGKEVCIKTRSSSARILTIVLLKLVSFFRTILNVFVYPIITLR